MARKNSKFEWLPQRRRVRPLVAALIAGTLAGAPGAKAERAIGPDTAVPELDDLGGAGLMETPSARTMPDAAIALGGGLNGPQYRSFTLAVQPVPWLETTLHETLRPPRAGQAQPIDGGIGLKARLTTESRWRPALALGLRDLAGGRFAGEYFVASKRVGQLDFSLGLGWGRLGEAGGLGNPLGALGRRYHRPRDPATAPAGPPSWFTGCTIAPFGGVAWQTPISHLVMKLELSPDRKRQDRQENTRLSPGGPINVGVSWRPLGWLVLGAGLEHGRDAMARATLLLNAEDLPLPRQQAADLPQATPSAVINGSRAIAWLEPAREIGDAYPAGQVIGRALRQMAERAPPGLEEVTVVAGAHGLDGVAVSALTRELRRAGRSESSPAEIRQSARLEPGAALSAAAGLPEGWRPETAPPWRTQVNVHYQQSPFESGQPWAYRLSFDIASDLDVTPGIVFSHTIRTTLSSNLETLDATMVRSSAARQQAVRSDLAWYVAAAPINTMEQAALTWLAQPAPEWTTRLAAGWFEELYAGFSGEVLYRPWRQRWALGLELDPVIKRLPGNTLLLEPGTDTLSGFGSLYYQSSDGHVDAAVHAGRSLGGDRGGTFELNRSFDNGLKLSGWLTGTTGANRLGIAVPQHRDRFDGGLRFSFPLGALPIVPSSSRFELEMRPLGRDSGQRAEVPLRLEPLTRGTSYGAITGTWGRLRD